MPPPKGLENLKNSAKMSFAFLGFNLYTVAGLEEIWEKTNVLLGLLYHIYNFFFFFFIPRKLLSKVLCWDGILSGWRKGIGRNKKQGIRTLFSWTSSDVNLTTAESKITCVLWCGDRQNIPCRKTQIQHMKNLQWIFVEFSLQKIEAPNIILPRIRGKLQFPGKHKHTVGGRSLFMPLLMKFSISNKIFWTSYETAIRGESV